jgi:Metallo-peptidase family M12/Secretion system C-terminal sorting domain/Fibronectin type III domain
MKYLHVRRLFLWSVFCLASASLVSDATAQSLRPVAQQVVTASQTIDFQSINLFAVKQTAPASAGSVSKSLKNATFAVSPDAEINRLYARNLAAMRLSIPFQDQQISVDVVRVEALTEDFKLSNQFGQDLSFKTGQFYRGIVSNDVNTVVSVNLFENEINGIISTPEHGNINFGKLTVANNVQDYIVYSDKDWLVPFSFNCNTESLKGYGKQLPSELSAQQIAINEAKCVRVGWEVTYALDSTLSKTSTTTSNYITSVFNNFATLYVNEGIRTSLAQLIIWTTPDGYTRNSTSTALGEYRTRRTTGLSGDLYHLIAPLPSGGGGGIAYVDVLCNTAYRYGYSQIKTTYSVVPTYSWTVEVLTHETGHNLGSPHTQSCSWPVTPTWTGGALDNCYAVEGSCSPGPAPTNGGTIMSYCHLIATGINFNNGFGTEPGNLIRAKVAAATCLTSCSTAACCGTPTGLVVSGTPTATTASVSWGAVTGASSYLYHYRTGTGAWSADVATTGTIANLTNLTGNTSYEVQVKSVCSNGSTACPYSASVSVTTATVAVTCCGTPSVFTQNIGSTTATIGWTAISGATSYKFRYRIGATGTWVALTPTTNSVVLSPLTASTTYQYEVQSVCSNGATTCPYSTTRSFTTTLPTCCGTVTNLAIPTLNPSTVTMSWGAVTGVTTYELQLKTSTATTWWTYSNLSGTGLSFYGLSPSTTYQWRVRAVCTNGVICWSTTASFTTLVACVDGNELNPSNNTRSGARTMTLGTIYNGTIPSGDNDWFKFTIPTATTFTVSLKNLGNNYVLDLYSSNGTTLLVSSNNTGLTNESITRTSTLANTVYYVNVRPSTITSVDAYTCYQLRAALGAALDAEPFGISIQLPSTVATTLQNPAKTLEAQIELFPNPTKGVLNLSISAAGTAHLTPIVDVIDMLGRKFEQKGFVEMPSPNESYLLDLNGFQEGIYLVRVQLGNQVTTHKVRVQR